MFKIRKKQSALMRTFLGAMLTASLIELSEVGAGFADMLMATRILGSAKAAAIGVISPLYSIMGIFSGILALGMQLKCSEEIARGNTQKMNRCFSSVFTLGLALSLLLTVCFILLKSPVIELLGAKESSGDLYIDSKDYITGLIIGLPPMFLYPLLAPVIQLDGNGKLVRVCALVSTFTDIGLNYLFIKSGMGMFGVGLASSCSFYVNLLILLIHFTNKNRQFFYKPCLPDFALIKDVIMRGKFKAIKRAANFLRPVIINNYIISMGGAVAMSAISIRNNTADFIAVVGVGVASAVSMVSGIAYSEKNKADIRQVGATAHKCILLIVCPIAVLLLIFAYDIAGLMVADNSALQYLVSFAIRIYAVEFFADLLISSRIQYLAAISQSKKADILTLCQRLLFIVPCVFLMGETLGVRGIIASFAVSYILILFAVYSYYAVKCKKLKLSADDFLLLDGSFDDSAKSTVLLEIRDLDDAALVAEQIQLFCNGHKFESKKANRAALCMEETIYSLFEGNGGNVPDGLEIYCTISEGDLIMRFRYSADLPNCFNYDVNAAPKDEFDKIGIRIIKKTAKSIKTFCVFKMHYVVICV